MPRPNLSKPSIVLGLVEAWPSRRTHCGKVRATASLDQPCAQCRQEPAGRDGGKSRSNKGNRMNKEKDAAAM